MSDRPVSRTTEPIAATEPTAAIKAIASREPAAASEADGSEPIGLTESTLEALLFIAERPLARREIATLAGVDRETVDARIGDLEVGLAARGIRLVVSGDRVELATAPEAGRLIGRYVGADATRLSPAALETLAIVAYRQPVTKGGIERIRGVDSEYTLRTLLHRRLIVELGRSEAPGRPYLYGTDFEFLERFGIASLDELPPLDTDVAARLVEPADEQPSGPGPAVGSEREPARGGAPEPSVAEPRHEAGAGPGTGVAVGPGPG